MEYDQLQQTAKDLEKERDAERKKLGMVLDKIQADASRFKQMLQNVRLLLCTAVAVSPSWQRCGIVHVVWLLTRYFQRWLR